MTTDDHPAVQEAATVKKASPEQRAAVARTLARAFEDDPILTWMLHTSPGRQRILQRFFDLGLRTLWLPQDECYTTERVAGAAVWELPGQWKTGIGTRLRLLPAMTSILGRHLPRAMRSLTVMESHHPTEPHYYLPLIGVDPDWQGQGIGSALLRPMLDRCDAEAMPAYLEASSERNRALYQRNGFVGTGEITLGKDAPPMWPMWREPVHAEG
ncbi:MAG: GNAT family N-acetyltransferase [Actinophytocola sp.]|nr:GNAT family N-acetyltransferase [Actinophytocola sp.]